jgi:hypothetical protein
MLMFGKKATLEKDLRKDASSVFLKNYQSSRLCLAVKALHGMFDRFRKPVLPFAVSPL